MYAHPQPTETQEYISHLGREMVAIQFLNNDFTFIFSPSSLEAIIFPNDTVLLIHSMGTTLPENIFAESVFENEALWEGDVLPISYSWFSTYFVDIIPDMTIYPFMQRIHDEDFLDHISKDRKYICTCELE